jgi:hypothetical protein
MLWKYILVNSNDLSHIGELSQARGKKLEVVLDKPGAASFSYPMDADYSGLISPYSTGIKAMQFNRMSSLVAGHDVWDCQWSGYVLPIAETADANSMAISCVGWGQRLFKRFVRRQKLYNAQDDGAIVQDLITEVNTSPSPGDGYTIPTPAGSNPNTPTWLSWGGTQPNEGVGGATAYVPLTDPSMGPAPRNKTVQKYTYVGSVIDELMSVENGGDLVVNPLTRAVTWHRKYRRVKDDVVLGFQWGPRNVKGFGRNIEADAQVNYIVVTGAPASTPQYAHDTAQQAQIGVIEETVALSDVVDNNVLLVYAGGEIIVRSNGLITYSVQPFSDEAEGVPEPFIDYRVGDQVRGTMVHAPRINIRAQALRVFGMTVDIDDNGVGSLGPLQVAP